jgi:hypothetical protein
MLEADVVVAGLQAWASQMPHGQPLARYMHKHCLQPRAQPLTRFLTLPRPFLIFLVTWRVCACSSARSLLQVHRPLFDGSIPDAGRKLVVGMVGLPARGKSYLVCISHCCWLACAARGCCASHDLLLAPEEC